MIKSLAVRKNNTLVNALLIFCGFTFMLVWLPVLRCLFDGSSYRWGQGYFGISLASEGLQPDYLVLLLFLGLYLALFYAAYWVANRSIFYMLLLWWWLHVFGSLIFEIIRSGDTMFHGDTLNVHISLKSIVYPLAIVALVLMVLVIMKDRKQEDHAIPWSRSNRIKAGILLIPILLQAFLFSMGEPHGITDQIGVVIAIFQAVLFPVIFFPVKSRSMAT